MDVKQTDVFLCLFTLGLNNRNMHSCNHTNNSFDNVIENDSFTCMPNNVQLKYSLTCVTSMTEKY